MATTRILPPAEASGYHTPVEIGRWVAIAAFAAASLIIAALAEGVPPCSRLVAFGLYAGWVAAPAIGIASLGAIVATTKSTTERYAVGALALVFLVAWAYALQWSSVGIGIDRVGC